ncbi:MAG: TonB-dependent receptor [Bryobacterales bacterium]|nr:TonB-dependent receptor [Bryobacterales bacterium]
MHRTPIFASILLFTGSLHAQITGEIRGTVTDPSGAAVAGAKATLTSVETGATRTAMSDADGRFAFSLLSIGDYQAAIEATGFRKAVVPANVRSAEITALSLKLEIGQVSEQVTVTDAVAALDTQSAQVQESFSTKSVQEIPVARNPNALAATLPGIVPAPGGFNSGSFITNGNRTRANNITIDNITATDISVGGTGSTNNGPLNFSSIKEVKIITNSFSAEFGRNAGAQVQYITKSGTNEFHGELYEFFRNNKLNARDWFDRSGSATVTRYNQFGGVFGGPVLRNKTHFFLSSEVVPIRGLGGARIAQVPTAAMLGRVTDPTSRRLLEQYKLPAATTEGADTGTVQQFGANFNDFHQYSVRLDHQLSSRDTIWGRYGFARNAGTSPGNTFRNTNLANFGFVSTNDVYSINLNETHVFSGTVINEFRSGFGRTSPIFDLLTDVPLGPRIRFANAQVAEFGQTEAGPQGRVQNTYQAGDTLTWTRGPHNFKFGGDFFRYQGNSFLDSQTRGLYTFLNWDDFAQGRPNAYTQLFGSTARGHRTWLQSAFAQDDYRITPALTLNLGFRMEVFGAVNEVNRLTSNLDFNCRDSLGAAGSGPLGCFTIGQDAVGTTYNYQPRVGFAWNPRGGKTVIRGGYGIVADFNFLNPISNQRALPPYVVTQQITGVANFAGGNTWSNLVGGTAPIQQEGLARVGRLPNDVLNYGNVSPVIDPKLRNPQVHNWHFGIQRELPQGIVLKAAYVGNKGNFLQRTRPVNLNGNAPAPAADLVDELARAQSFVNSFAAMTGSARAFAGRTDRRFNTVNYYDNSANSNFHAFEFSGTKRFKDGYSITTAYTWGKSIDDTSDSLTAIPNDDVTSQNPNNLRENRGLSAFDVPHRFVMTHVWELPWGRKVRNAALRRVLDGWGTSGISSWRAGFPVGFEAGPRLGVQNLSAVHTAGIIRVNAAGPFAFNPVPAGSAGAPQGLTTDSVAGRRISAYAASLGLSQPLLGNFGTLGRATHRLNGSTNFDWNVYKSTKITERVELKLRCEMYNIFNHHSFRDVNRNIANTAFGQYTTPEQSQRLIQLGAVLQF